MTKKTNFISKINILLIIFLSFAFYQCNEKKQQESFSPKIVQVSKNEVVIKWESMETYEGSISYQSAEKKEGRPSSGKDIHESPHHKVVINDLLPGTIYKYWLKNAKTQFTFQTAPENNNPFSFVIAGGDSSEDYTSLIASENCGFMLSIKGRHENAHKTDNSYLPVFYLDGNNPGLNEDSIPQSAWKLDWGNLRLVLINKETDILSFLNVPGNFNHIVGVIFNSGILSENIDEIRSSAFHQKIIHYNKTNVNSCGCSKSAVAFVCIVNYPVKNFNLDGINYFSIPVKNKVSEKSPNPNSVVVNINDESASAYFPATNNELILKMPPPHGNITCTECGRLTKKGSYEESIKAYESFIEKNRKLYQVDDAYFAIAQILDEKLFRFSKAQEWYQLVVDSFPEGTLAFKAKQRINYFAKYSDYNFEPLEKFERIKSRYEESNENMMMGQQRMHKGISQKKQKLLDKAEEINKEYADCKVVPEITLWLAIQYQQSDSKKALDYYATLQNKYPEFSKKNEVALKIAETYDHAKLFKDARSAYIKAKDELPKLTESINLQLALVNKNITRINIKHISWFLAIIILLISILIKPFGMKLPRIKTLLITLSAFIYTFLIFFIILREEIIQMFNSYKEITLFFIAYMLLIPLSMIIAKTFTAKLCKGKIFIAKLLGGTIGMIFFISVFYLIIYSIYEQFLIFI
jgi:tetratricopeptide (TPR) repeat protein